MVRHVHNVQHAESLDTQKRSVGMFIPNSSTKRPTSKASQLLTTKILQKGCATTLISGLTAHTITFRLRRLSMRSLVGDEVVAVAVAGAEVEVMPRQRRWLLELAKDSRCSCMN